ncbi:MFS transporter [Chromobacterium sp. IIBBL 290-4]|uniref:MFS transporter n=1 Tax=Chromobacterium sp. IIBBL 290-4 TaxID=2953890 RepID=UPI0020B8FB09|nr:MFS transporter [Chromobacterium sp. IIBBL 290-4]UTH75265.1 MFS transporter [Chromobacterium sp. IIBBL 290-4]
MNTSAPGLGRGMALLFAVSCGAVIGNIYYAQPLLAVIAGGFGAQPSSLGFIVTLTQLGYACGLLLLVPLGDALDRRKLIVTLLGCSALALMAVAASPSLGWFAAACAALGLCTCAAQLLVPFAASLAAEHERGRVVGTVMSGLLLGILLARTFSGLVAQLGGWRLVYWLAAGVVLLFTAILARALPSDRHSQSLRYGALLASLLTLARAHPALRLRGLYGGLAFACFSLFWTGLTFLLSQPPYGYSEAQIGAFGLVGAAGTLAASGAGRLSDRGHGRRVTSACCLGILLAFGLLWLGGHWLAALLAGVLLLDICVQALHISNQSVIYALQPEARSRITTVYLVSYFLGGELGSGAASLAYAHAGWTGVCLAGAGMAALLQLARLTAKSEAAKERSASLEAATG